MDHDEIMKLSDQEKVEHCARMVRDLLITHNLAGAFFLCAPTHAADGIMFDTAPWIRLKLETDDEGRTIGARIRSKLDEYKARGLNEEAALKAQQTDIESTISALDFLGLHMGQFSIISLNLLEMAREKFGSVTTENRVGDAWGPKPS